MAEAFTLDNVSEDELTQTLMFIEQYHREINRTTLDPIYLAHKILRVIHNTRDGYTCPACRMGECAN